MSTPTLTDLLPVPRTPDASRPLPGTLEAASPETRALLARFAALHPCSSISEVFAAVAARTR